MKEREREIEKIIGGACEEQAGALAAYAASGNPDDMAKVHFETCPLCDHALDAIVQLREEMGLKKVPVPVVRASLRERIVGYVLMTTIVTFIGGLTSMLGYKLYDSFRPRTESQSLDRLTEDFLFFRDGRSELCFRVNGYNGDIAYAPCEQARASADDRLHWMSESLSFFQDRRNGVCFARMRHHGDLQAVPVPCGAALKFLTRPSQDGRWLLEPEKSAD